jgi:hypothetical protein
MIYLSLLRSIASPSVLCAHAFAIQIWKISSSWLPIQHTSTYDIVLVNSTFIVSSHHRLALTPFSRIVFSVPYDDDDTFMMINNAIKRINSNALQNIQGKYVHVSLWAYANHNSRLRFDRWRCIGIKNVWLIRWIGRRTIWGTLKNKNSLIQNNFVTNHLF